MADAPDLMALAESLRSLLPAEELTFDPDNAYAVDGMTPLVLARPRTQQEVAAVLRASSEAGAAVIPRGAGTQLQMGMPPERYDLALDLSNLERVIDHEPADLTVTADAAQPWSSVQDVLAKHGQWVPLDPAVDERATVGGILATNASGPARIRYGAARDLVIGMTVALADGSIVKSGGRVVKNVAGYDMAKLHIGALGTLGVILQASFKVSPLAESRPSVSVQGKLPMIAKLADRVLAARLPLLGLELIGSPGEPWKLHTLLGGGATAVERALAEVAAMASDAGATVTEATDASRAEGFVEVRVSVQPNRTPDAAEALSAAGARVVAYPAIGTLRGVWDEPPKASVLTSLRRSVAGNGGVLVLEAAPVELKNEAGVWGDTRGDFALMQRLKQQFDSKRTLNPGRFVGGI